MGVVVSIKRSAWASAMSRPLSRADLDFAPIEFQSSLSNGIKGCADHHSCCSLAGARDLCPLSPTKYLGARAGAERQIRPAEICKGYQPTRQPIDNSSCDSTARASIWLVKLHRQAICRRS
jgi:hypothetical protein